MKNPVRIPPAIKTFVRSCSEESFNDIAVQAGEMEMLGIILLAMGVFAIPLWLICRVCVITWAAVSAGWNAGRYGR